MTVEDIPGVGRIGVMLDSQGAALGLMRAATGDDPVAGMPGEVVLLGDAQREGFRRPRRSSTRR